MEDFLGVTAIILSVSYREQEFFRVGYYVYNAYTDPELNENPPEQIQFDKVVRSILADKPRITRFDIKWEDSTKEEENIGSTVEHTPDIVLEGNPTVCEVNPFTTSIEYVKPNMFDGNVPTKEDFN
jgi:hypothetical protein